VFQSVGGKKCLVDSSRVCELQVAVEVQKQRKAKHSTWNG